jgi:hypothetical protein
MMRQKFLISRNLEKKELKIMEYAVIDKNLKKVTSENLDKNNFALVGEETYKSESIIDSIAQGDANLIGTLRTRNIFPISTYASKIAEKIKEIYTLSDDFTTELFFDDCDLISVAQDVD